MMFLSLILFVISNAISAFFRPCLQLSFLDLKVFLKKEQYDSKFPLNYGLGREQIVYLDDDIVVVNKPPHALSVPGVRSNDSVASRIARLLKIESVDTMIVHRLDYATSGILLLARNYPSLLSLNTQFRRPNVVSKAYVAVVGGKVNCSEGEVRLPLSQDLDRGYPYCKVSFEGKESLTLWQNLFSVNNNSILRLFPITGRTHQLRLHCTAMGHPIIGDYFYGSEETFQQADRLLLHAEYLSFYHPRTRKAMAFRIPILKEWNRYLQNE